MRYFLFLLGPEASLASGVVVPASACQAVAQTRSAQALLASNLGALTGAVVVPPVAVTTDKHLATAAGTEVVTGTGQHRLEQADEGWIYTGSGATLNGLCDCTVQGMASVLTAKSRPTLCPSHQPLPHTVVLLCRHP